MYFPAGLAVVLLFTSVVLTHSKPLTQQFPEASVRLNTRVKRQIDLTLSAEHDDKEDETELALEAIANLWRSSDGNTQIDGSAKVLHHSNALQNGNTQYSARLHLHHDYRKR